jgi:hypothetical protein
MKRIVLLVTLLTVSFYGVFSVSYDARIWTWPNGRAVYYVNPNNGDSLQSSAVIAAIQEGANAWSSQPDSDISLAYGGTTNSSTRALDRVNNVFFSTESNSNVIADAQWWYDGSGDLIDFDIRFFDGGWVFYTGTEGCSGGFYIEDVVAHEFGHGIGFGHSDVGDATMYPSISRCATTSRSLAADDIAGAAFLYPAGSGGTLGSPPTAPSGLVVAGATTSSISLRWTDNSNNESGFGIERSSDGMNFSEIRRVIAASATDSGLSSGQTYSYRVRAYNSYGTSGYSNTIDAMTLSVTSAPLAVTNPSPTQLATGVSVTPVLSWSVASGAETYNIYFGTTPMPPLAAQGLTSNSFSPGGLSNSTTYYWRVEAVNVFGATSSAEWQFTTRAQKGKKPPRR